MEVHLRCGVRIMSARSGRPSGNRRCSNSTVCLIVEIPATQLRVGLEAVMKGAD